MAMIRISICIPAHNNIDFLIRAIDSVLIQTYSDYEIIISDDTKDDSIKDILNTIYPTVGAIKYFKNTMHSGAVANWNNAISHATSPLIKLLHHDDWFSNENCLEKLVKPFLIDPELDFVFCQSNHYDGNKFLEKCEPNSKALTSFSQDPSYIFKKNFIISPSSTLYRKTVLEYDTNLTWMVDVDFYVTYLKNRKFQYIPESLINLNISQGRLTEFCENNPELLIKECLYLFNKYNDNKLAQKNILNYFRKIIKNHSLYNTDNIKAIIPLNELHPEMLEVVNGITYKDLLSDKIYRVNLKFARTILGPNFKSIIRNFLKIFSLFL